MMERLLKLKNVSSKLSLLYIEDDHTLQNKTKGIFDNLFKVIDVANDGEGGVLQYETYFYENQIYYDIVVTDIRMPKLDGIGVVKKILSQNKDQKIIVTSAFGEKDDLIEFINLGISKFMQKPFTMDQLINTLYQVVDDLVDNEEDNIIQLSGDLFWNKLLKELTYQDKVIKLSYNEIIILTAIINHPEKIFSQFDLYNLIMVEGEVRDFSQDSLKSIIKRLRQKLPYDVIQNIYAQGYRLQLVK